MSHPHEREIEIFLTKIMHFDTMDVQPCLPTFEGTTNFCDFCHKWTGRNPFAVCRADSEFKLKGYKTFFGEKFLKDMRALMGPKIDF